MTDGALLRRLYRAVVKGSRQADVAEWSAVLGVGVVGGIGVATLAIHLVGLATVGEGLFSLFSGSVIPGLLSLLLLVIGVWVYRQHSGRMALRVGSWCLVGALTLTGVSAMSVGYQSANGVSMVDVRFVVTAHATVGAVLGSLVGIYDHQRHQRGRHLESERERAEKLSNRLTILNRFVRHDIRNVVNVVQANATLILDDVEEPATAARTIRSKAEKLHKRSDRARQLQQLLELESRGRTRVDVCDVLESQVSRFAKEYPDARFEVNVPESAPVRAVSLVEDAVEELIENAIEHNDAPTPRVEITVTWTQHGSVANGDGKTVVLRVSDNGPGIPANELELLQRGLETELEHSNGLGLWFIHWAVHASDGRIVFEENHPRGSTVELRLQPASEQVEV
ncbi:sensor histidine kinase [Salinibaculum marinum]|uniref:sensor histidine kinase n=1 Tax=Salinibaculum marinum TaxID=3131993 RepID=UPI0030CCCBD8